MKIELTLTDVGLNYERAVLSLLPLEAVLRTSPFLAGDAPGFVDYVAYGRWCMVLATTPVLASQIWMDRETPVLREWIARLEAKYAQQLGQAFKRMPRVIPA